jgi:DNA-binding response OmpR family regulator
MDYNQLGDNIKERGAIINIGDIRLDPVSHLVFKGNKKIELSHKEYSLLLYMIRNPNKILTREMIKENVFNNAVENNTFSNIVDVYINYLRKKIEIDGSKKMINTIRGKGYIFEIDFNDNKFSEDVAPYSRVENIADDITSTTPTYNLI